MEPSKENEVLLTEEKFKSLNIEEDDTKHILNGINEKVDGKLNNEVDGLTFGESSNMKNNIGQIISNGKLPKGFVYTCTDNESTAYNMNHQFRGRCVIFNHHVFSTSTGLGVRNGTNQDKNSAQTLFTNLGFDVDVFDNLSVKDVLDKLEYYSLTYDHSENDCFAVVFMSHGEDGHLFGRDAPFQADKLYNAFTANKCPSLANKPKLFFIQACRGDGIDSGVTMVRRNNIDETDAGPQLFYKIPVHADFLICWSTVPGHFSWRNTTNGSWFMQALVKIISQYCKDEDLLSMMTMVNHKLVSDFESNCPSSPGMHKKKQTAYFVSTLTRKVFMKPRVQQ